MSSALNITGVYLRSIFGWVITLAQDPHIPVFSTFTQVDMKFPGYLQKVGDVIEFETKRVRKVIGITTSIYREEDLPSGLNRPKH